jgi:hypothetical protein
VGPASSAHLLLTVAVGKLIPRSNRQAEVVGVLGATRGPTKALRQMVAPITGEGLLVTLSFCVALDPKGRGCLHDCQP